MLFEEDAVIGMVTLTQPAGMAWSSLSGVERASPVRRSIRAKSGIVCIIMDVYVFGVFVCLMLYVE